MGVGFDMNIAHYTPPTHINSVNKNKTINNSKRTIPPTTTNTTTETRI